LLAKKFFTWYAKKKRVVILQAERYRRIEQLLQNRDLVGVAELETDLAVSRATIYRDLKALNRDGKIRLVRGGIARPADPFPLQKENAYDEKARANADEKARIAAYASELIRPGSTIFLDSSTTLLNICPHVKRIGDLFVITNDVRIAAELSAAKDVSVYVMGGHLRRNYYTLTNRAPREQLREIAIDVAFLSCDAITPRHGCMVANDGEVPLKKFVLSHAAQRSVVVCDHSKFNRTAFISFANVTDFTHIITGRELSDELYQSFYEVCRNIVRV